MHRGGRRAVVLFIMSIASVQALSGFPSGLQRHASSRGWSLVESLRSLNLLRRWGGAKENPGSEKLGLFGKYERFSSGLRLRGGAKEKPDADKLRDLFGKRENGASLLDLLGLALALRPVTRFLLLVNLASYVASSLGWMGEDAEEKFGFRSDKVLEAPRFQLYRCLSSHWLHASHSHLVGNMLVLLAVGGKLEEHLGSAGLARLVLTIIPVVGVAQVSLTIVFNGLLRLVGFGKAGKGSESWLNDIIRQQASFGTTSVGFSAILFALNALASFVLEPENVEYCVSLASLPPAIRMPLMNMLGVTPRDKLMSKDFCVPARVWPLVQILLTQLADPARLSLTGHLAGLVAAVSIKSVPMGILSIPLHIGAWMFARNVLKIRSPPEPPLVEPHRTWNLPTMFGLVRSLVETAWKFASSVLQGDDFRVGERVVLHGLVQRQDLNGREAVIEAIRQDGRLSVRLVGKDSFTTVAVSKQNARRVSQDKQGESESDQQSSQADVEKWSVAQVSAWLRKKGYGELVGKFASNSIGGHALVRLNNEDFVEMKVPIGVRKALQADIEELRKRSR